MKILTRIRRLKFVMYKFLGKFMPYFRNKLLMLLEEVQKNIEDNLNDFIRRRYNGYFEINGNQKITSNTTNDFNSIKYTIEVIINDIINKKTFEIRFYYYLENDSISLEPTFRTYIYVNGEKMSSILNFLDNIIVNQLDIFSRFNNNK